MPGTERTELRCSCRAQRDKSSTRCLKCRRRAGWYRRKAWHSHKNPARYQFGRK